MTGEIPMAGIRRKMLLILLGHLLAALGLLVVPVFGINWVKIGSAYVLLH